MPRWTILFASLALSWSAVPTLAQEKDAPGAKDHPLLTRMPGYCVATYEPKDFDSIDQSAYLTGDDARWEGKSTKLGYAVKSGTKPVSMIQIARNYAAAIKKAGGKVLADNEREILGRFEKGGVKTWVQCSAFNDGASYTLLIVEAAAMQQEVTADASALQAVNRRVELGERL